MLVEFLRKLLYGDPNANAPVNRNQRGSNTVSGDMFGFPVDKNDDLSWIDEMEYADALLEDDEDLEDDDDFFDDEV